MKKIIIGGMIVVSSIFYSKQMDYPKPIWNCEKTKSLLELKIADLPYKKATNRLRVAEAYSTYIYYLEKGDFSYAEMYMNHVLELIYSCPATWQNHNAVIEAIKILKPRSI
jgi:hypothetical protein